MKEEGEVKNFAGIYVHIPFCHQACSYCDFYFSVHTKHLPIFIQAILKEIELKKDFFCNQEKIRTLYFGGGTPSLLTPNDLQLIYTKIINTFQNIEIEEFTIEVNPEDVTKENLKCWKALGVNRISLGVQSIHEEELTFMKRNHTSQQIFEALDYIKESGIENFTVDVIYGIPIGSVPKLKKTLQKLLIYEPKHFSCYALTVEPKTLLDYQLKKKQWVIEDDNYVKEYEFLVNFLQDNGYFRYEISNFSKKGYESRHNASYWRHVPYLGLGPSAHSFDGKKRSSNIANLHRYEEKLSHQELPTNFEETLSKEQIQLEQLMFKIRQNQGIEIHYFNRSMLEDWLKKDWIYREEEKIFFTNKGLMLSDSLILQII